MQIPLATVQHPSSLAAEAAAGSQPIRTYLGWELFLSRIFRERTDKGLWLHWCYPADRESDQKHEIAVRYGYFVAPTQTLEEALHAVYQSIDAIVELESMTNDQSLVSLSDPSEQSRQVLPIAG